MNPKNIDAVAVLREALERIAEPAENRNDCNWELACQSMEQTARAALAATDRASTVAKDTAVAEVIENFSDEIDIKWIGNMPPVGTKLYTTPKPEASAEQVGVLHLARVTEPGSKWHEVSERKAAMLSKHSDLYEVMTVQATATPAVKPEASAATQQVGEVDHREIIDAAEAVVARWYTPKWKDEQHTAVFINRLRDALGCLAAPISEDTGNQSRSVGDRSDRDADAVDADKWRAARTVNTSIGEDLKFRRLAYQWQHELGDAKDFDALVAYIDSRQPCQTEPAKGDVCPECDATMDEYSDGNKVCPFGHVAAQVNAESDSQSVPAPTLIPTKDARWPFAEAADTLRLDWLEKMVVNVRDPLRYGSRDLFWSSPPDDEDERGPSDIRAEIDKHRNAKPPGG